MMELRSYRTEDAQTILSWCGSEQAFYMWTAGVLGAYPLSPEEFDKVSGMMAFTAVENGAPIGFFTLRYPEENRDVIRFGFVTVDAGKRGRGCGKEMLRLGLEYAKEVLGAKKATLGVFTNNPAAYHCYKAVGFADRTETERYPVMGEKWICRELEMEL